MLDAVVRILKREGIARVTTNRVAEIAGVSIGSVYQYFPSKEALVGELVDRDCERMDALFGDVFLRAQGLPPPELARALVGAVYRAKVENPALARVLREQIPLRGRLCRLEENLARITETVASYLAHHRETLRVGDPARAAFYAVELAEALTMAAVLKPGPSGGDRAVDEITDILVRYLFR